MSIANLLAQGPQFTPIEPRANALMRAQQMQDAQLRNALMRQQMQAAQAEQAQRAQQNALMQQWRNSIPSPQMAASQHALAAGGGPTVANAQRMQPVDPRLQMLHGGMMAGAVSPVDYLNAAMPAPKQPEYKVVGDALVKIGPQGVSEAYKGAQKPSDPPGSVKEYEYAKAQGYQGTFEQWDIARRRAAAASTSVNYSTPVEAVDANGNRVFIRTTKDGLTPAIIPGVRPPMSGAEEKAASEKAARERQGQQMTSAMSDARRILSTGNATASGVGNVADAAARVVGVSTVGAQDAARLEALSGWLVANVPRMEGPQSNFDVQNYTTMAGKVGDRTVPIKERLAALAEVENLQRKYATINGTPIQTGNPASGPKVGTVESGYRFKGGNPADANNWEPVR